MHHMPDNDWEDFNRIIGPGPGGECYPSKKESSVLKCSGCSAEFTNPVALKTHFESRHTKAPYGIRYSNARYALIHAPDEDGREIQLLTDDELESFLDNPEEYSSVDSFLDKMPDDTYDINDEEAVLIKFEIVKVKEKTKAWKLVKSD